MSAESRETYVVSADLTGLLKEWGVRSGYSVPSKDYLLGLSDDLQSALADSVANTDVEVVHEAELSAGIRQLVEGFGYPVVSLDRAYVNKETPNLVGYIDVTRAVDTNFNSLGLLPRAGCPSLANQINGLAKDCQGRIALVDDVIFSGEDLAKSGGIIEQLKQVGLDVDIVIAGIGIGEGVEKVRKLGIDVVCVREYEKVRDEVCKRDFFAAVPMSGRMVVDENGQIWSAPYFGPFGDAVKWASIDPEKAADFSRFCLEQSISLWSEIERQSQATVLTEATPRSIKGLTNGISIVSALKEKLDL
jgi:hypothetical protein